MSLERRFNERQQKRFAKNLRDGDENFIVALATQYGVTPDKLYDQHIRSPREVKRLFGIELPEDKKEHPAHHRARQLAHKHGVSAVRGVPIPEPDQEILASPKKAYGEAAAA